MNTERISLQISYEKAGLSAPADPATLEPVFIPHLDEHGSKQRPAVVICPGGGYDYCSEREALPVALRFAGNGVQAFVLRYTCQKPFPTNLLELAAAVAYVRSHAAEYEVDPNRIAVAGFSAGGHLAASLAVYWNSSIIADVFGSEYAALCKPDAQILSYPVITAGAATHGGSIINLVGAEAAAHYDDPRTVAVSLEKHVSAATPPCFIWHTSNDDCVPVQNSLLYMQSLAANQIPFEAHILPHGSHGLSLADDTTAMGEWHENPVCAPWFNACIAWIRRGYA